MNTSKEIFEPTRYDENGNESPTGLLVFYSDWKELADAIRALRSPEHAAPDRSTGGGAMPEYPKTYDCDRGDDCVDVGSCTATMTHQAGHKGEYVTTDDYDKLRAYALRTAAPGMVNKEKS